MEREAPPPGIPHLDDDACLDFAAGLLDEATRRRMLGHAAGCAACEERLRLALAAREIGRARAAGALSATPGPRVTPLPARPRAARGVPRAWLAAAGLVAVIGAVWLAAGPRDRGPVAPPLESHRLPSLDGVARTHVRSESPADSAVFAGIAAYERDDFAQAAMLLGSGAVTGGLESMRRVYLAGAQLELELPALALETLSDVRDLSLPDPWHDEARWCRMLALERTGHRASADSLLEALASGAGPVAERARARLAGSRPGR